MARRIDRRMFLRGAAGFTLAIPFLPSLAERDAKAAPPGTKRFIAFGTEHGGVWQENMYPVESTLTDSQGYAGHTIHRGDLALNVEAGTARLSPVLSAPSNRFTSAIAAKMNVLRGFDLPFDIGHNQGGYLGNYARNLAESGIGRALQDSPRPTIDQLMAWSPNFYGDLSTILARSLVLGKEGMSAGWGQPSNQTGGIDIITPQNDNRALFAAVVPDMPDDPAPTRPLVVDRILDDYRRLRDGNRRLSVQDRTRLSNHLDRIDELERRLNVVVSCDETSPPMSGTGDLNLATMDAQIAYWQLLNDVIVAALACDTCRVVTALLGEETKLSDFSGNWHQDIAHKADYVSWPAPPSPQDGHPQSFLVASKQAFFEHIFLDLIEKLDAVDDGPGGTLLDGTLVQWGQESGPATHESLESPIVTAGGAAGALRTGQYCDYRNRNAVVHEREHDGSGANTTVVITHRGLIYNQWLGTVLQAMDIPPTEYESGGYGGYGEVVFGLGEDYYPSTGAHVNAMGDPVPFVMA